MTPHAASGSQNRPGFLSRLVTRAKQARNFLAFPRIPSPPQQGGSNAQSQRQVPDDPRDAWQLWFPRNLDVQQVTNILRASRMGDQWQLASLVEVMLDSWPMLKKCQHELRSAVSQTKFSVHAFTEGGKEPTARAKEKADLVRRAMNSYRPNPAVTDERGFAGMVYDLANAYLLGMSLVELQWQVVNGDKLPRAATFCHPAHIVLDDFAQVQIANSKDGSTIPLNPNFFLTSVFQSQSGSVYAMGMVRSVGWWWAAMLAVQTWMFGSAQKYGSPYTFLTYARSLMGNTIELAKIEEALSNSGANRYIMTPEGCEADLKPPGSMGQDNPQRYMYEQANREVQQLFLGQNSSTQAEPGRLGNNDQHNEVRQERKEAVAKWIGQTLTEQWATAILRQNYGEDTECPTVEPDFTEIESRLQTAQRIQILVNSGLPLNAEEIYNDLNLTVPEKGDLTVQRGQLGIMSDPAETPIQPGLEEQVAQQSLLAEASGKFEQPVAARTRSGTARIKASSFIGDMLLRDLPEGVSKDVLRFVPNAKPTSKLARYGMVVEELKNKVDPHNWETATGHIAGQELDREKFEARRDGKYILLVNDRIVDGHHFLALADGLHITSSLNVLDLTPARMATKAREEAKWIVLQR